MLLSDDAGGAEPHMITPYWEHPRGLRASIYYRMMIIFTQLGEFDAGRRLAEQCFRESEAFGDPLGTLRLHIYIGLGKLETGASSFESAVRAFESASALCREDFNGDAAHMIRWGLGLAYVLIGRPTEGLMLFEKADAALRGAGEFNFFSSTRFLHHALALIAAGRLEHAEGVAGEALRLAREGGNRPSEASAHGLLGEVARLRDPLDHEGMERHVRDALILAEALEMRPLAARCHLRLAWLHERTGGPDRDRHAAAARSLLDQMGGHVKVDAAGVH